MRDGGGREGEREGGERGVDGGERESLFLLTT